MRKTRHGSIDRLILQALFVLAIVITPLSQIFPRWEYYTIPYYTEKVFSDLENVFGRSQYRQKYSPAIIPDETVFSYASGAYMRGMDPILVNSEHTPLGKYMIGLSILVLKNDRFPAIVFGALTGVSIWLLGRIAMGSALLAFVPLFLVTLDRLFLNQLTVAPLLDIVQLPFIYLTLAAFLFEQKRPSYILTATAIGLVMATKTVVPGILLVGSIGLFLFLYRRWSDILRFVAWLPLSAVLFVLSYTRTFMDGYTLWDFFKFQKWIFLYQKSKLLYPFSSLRLLMLNQWQTWWGDFSLLRADDWSYLWPISTLASALVILWLVRGKRWKQERLAGVVMVALWVGVYQMFLSIGVVSSRFFLPLLPAQYMLLVFGTAYMFRVRNLLPRRSVIAAVMLMVVYAAAATPVSAEYVLPYPSYMPGNKLYTISRIVDRLKRYWNWGDIARTRYSMALSDKHLVEAKTLFEYRQYLLGADALARSDREFLRIPEYIRSADMHKKDISGLNSAFAEEIRAQKEALTKMRGFVPEVFVWQPEKSAATTLPLGQLLLHAIAIRDTATGGGVLK